MSQKPIPSEEQKTNKDFLSRINIRVDKTCCLHFKVTTLMIMRPGYIQVKTSETTKLKRNAGRQICGYVHDAYPC